MFSGHIALNDPIHDGGVKLTYSEAASRISKLAGGLQALRLTKGDKIGLFAENSYRSVHSYTYIHTYIHTYMHMHTYIHTCRIAIRSVSLTRARARALSLSQTHTHTLIHTHTTHTHRQTKHRNALKEIEPVPNTMSTD
jgi:long-subunit acyl-CoA synthetase (AMP-forming)